MPRKSKVVRSRAGGGPRPGKSTVGRQRPPKGPIRGAGKARFIPDIPDASSLSDAGLVRRAKTTLDDSEIKNLASNPVQVAPFTQPGEVFVPIYAALVFRNEDAEYLGLEDESSLFVDGFASIGPQNTSFASVYDFLSGGFTPLVLRMPPDYSDYIDPTDPNQPGKTKIKSVYDVNSIYAPTLTLNNPGTNPLTGGHVNNRLDVIVIYSIFEL